MFAIIIDYFQYHLQKHSISGNTAFCPPLQVPPADTRSSRAFEGPQNTLHRLGPGGTGQCGAETGAQGAQEKQVHEQK